MLGDLVSGGMRIIGGQMASDASEKSARMNIKYQKEFAKKGITWRVKDALNAGIHPIYALGAQSTSFSPVSMGGGELGQGLADAGQDIGRAVSAMETADERVQSKLATALQLKNMELKNDYLAAMIAKETALPPAFPSNNWLLDGQGDVPKSSMRLVEDKPMERTVSQPGALHSEPGAVADVGYTRDSQGRHHPVMSEDAKKRLEEDHIGMIMWNIRNRLLPFFNVGASPPPHLKGKDWTYGVLGGYRPAKRFLGLQY